MGDIIPLDLFSPGITCPGPLFARLRVPCCHLSNLTTSLFLIGLNICPVPRLQDQNTISGFYPTGRHIEFLLGTWAVLIGGCY
jgi:hypothetical protein